MPDRALAEEKRKARDNVSDNGQLPLTAETGAVREEAETVNDALWETQLFQVYNGSVSLKYPPIEPGDVTTRYTMTPAALQLQEGVVAMPASAPGAAQVSAYQTKDREGVIFTALGGRVELAIANFHEETEAELATMNLVSDRFLTGESASLSGELSVRQSEGKTEQAAGETFDTEISAYFKDTVVIEPIEGLRIELGQGEYIKNKNEQNPKLRFPKTRLVFAAQSLTDSFLTELDRTGLHTPEEEEIWTDDQKEGSIPARQVLEELRAHGDQTAMEPEPEEDAAEAETLTETDKAAEEETQEKQEAAWKGFFPGDLTKDQFVRMEEAEYAAEEAGGQLKEQHGKARFRFMEIPYTIPLFNQKELNGRTKEKESGERMLPFYVDPLGNLTVDFEEPIELPLTDREEIAGYLVAAIRLEDASIQGSRLIAGKIRIDLGVAAAKEDQEEEEEQSDEGRAKKLFGKNLHGTFANVSEIDSIDEAGIHAAPGRKSLGEFGVSKFLGFLDVEGDYPAGHLEVAFENQKETEKKKLFSETVQNVLGEGLSIPIIGPLAFELSVSPSVSIGGSLSAELNRGKSFGEALSPDENLELAGKAGMEGEGKLDMAAGLALTPGLISSVKLDFKLGSELSAGIGVTAEADTALGLREEKLKQTKPLELDGRVEIQLKGNVNLSSNVQFFVWHATLFQVELYSKEVQIRPFQGHASRDVGAEGLTRGWHFEKMGLSARSLGEKTVEAMRDSKDLKKVREQKLEMSKEAAESLGRDVEDAWTLLEELKRQGGLANDRAYLVEQNEKDALEERIAAMTREVEAKITKYMEALGNYKGQLYQKAEETKTELEKARRERTRCMGQDTLRQMTMRDVQRGGFRMEEYQPLSEEEGQRRKLSLGQIRRENERRNQKAAIDFTMARAIGIYDNALDEQIFEYDMLARERNYQSDVDRRQGRKNPYQDFTYPLFRELGMEKLLNGIRKEDNTGYWFGGARDSLYVNTIFGFDRNADIDPSQHRNNYFRVLYEGYLDYKELPVGYSAEFEPIFKQRNSQGELKSGKKGMEAVRKYEFVKILLSGLYPKGIYDAHGNSLEGKPIPKLEANDKMKLFKAVFKGTLSGEDNLSNFLAWFGLDTKETTQREKMMVDVNKVLQEVFDSNLEEMVAGGKTDMNAKLQELDDRLEASKTAYIQAAEKHYGVEQAIKTVTQEQAKYKARLFGLKVDVEEGMKLENGSVRAAGAAVNFIQNDYEAIAAGGRLPDLAVVGFGEDSEAYREMKKYEEEAFPERKNAGRALKASVTQ